MVKTIISKISTTYNKNQNLNPYIFITELFHGSKLIFFQRQNRDVKNAVQIGVLSEKEINDCIS